MWMESLLLCTPFYNQETAELQKKQNWYQQNQVNMHKDDEEEYLAFCSEAMFRIHILELRLNRSVPIKQNISCTVW